MLTTFSVKTKAGTPDHSSCDQIVEKFFEKLEPYLTEDLCRRKATVFFFEDFYYTSGGKAARGLSAGRLKVLGVIEWMLRESGLKLYAVQPAAMTSFLLSGKTPKGSDAKKAAVKEWLHLHRNFYTTNDNLADAYGLAEFGYAVAIEGQRLTYRALFSAV